MKSNEAFVITSEWLHAHATPRGGWTAQQLSVFGIAWPPRKGWLASLVGTVTTLEKKARFEAQS